MTSPISIKSKTRSAIFDCARGVGIILVVYGHCARGLASFGAIHFSTTLAAVDYAIYSFHMPLFFFISGIFVENSLRYGLTYLLRSRFISIGLPYFFWSIVQLLVQIALSGSSSTNNAVDPGRLLTILWHPISPFWFLYALFFAVILVAITRRLIGPVYIVALMVCFMLTERTFVPTISDIIYGTLYVAAGSYAQSCGFTDLVKNRAIPLVLASSALLLVSIYLGLALDIPYKLLFPAAFFGLIAVLCGSALLPSPTRFPINTLALVGRCSMAIYVSHIILLGLIRLILVKFLHIENVGILLGLGTVFAVAGGLALQRLSDHFRISRYLALPANRTRTPASGFSV